MLNNDAVNDDTVKVLNGLIQTSEDGMKGFAEAAEDATTPELKTVFHQRSLDCGAAVTELQGLVMTLGGTPKDSGTIAGAARRGWTKVKATVGDANISTLEEVESAEDKAKAVYTKALTATLMPQVRSVVQRQHDGAVRNHDLIRDLRNSYKANKAAIAH
ncbi:MAG: aldehyde dehydrogenase [Hydrocarboniphaga sp.]|uniref:PA2169 family four-helix-bundle protein n=1 Tax=Hydrocarboniphaga sp. TaxID=2033016 RepID=UPI00261B5D34|nr:PA2169 family four-helix-bundle protein [Hydrocarboniphaga sp.]MDB5968218.1 aldehyde dehydrogenase [Hydrocarboniphaga sp.]